MEVAIRMLFPEDLGGLPGTVMGTGEKGGEGDHVDVAFRCLVGGQIFCRRGAGSMGGLLTHGHGVRQQLCVQGIVVPVLGLAHVDGQRHSGVQARSPLLRGEVAAAVHNDLKTHNQKPLI